MNTILEHKIKQIFKKWSGEEAKDIRQLPSSASSRIYFRICGKNSRALCAYNPDKRENNAFVKLTNNFLNFNLKVPEIYDYAPEDNIYLLQDLGDSTLYSILEKLRQDENFPVELLELYKKVIRQLPHFQVTGGKSIDYSLCYPRKSFDRQSMSWDLNYFKYYFLKLAEIQFDEQEIENDFDTLIEFLLKCDRNYFLYRDFQSRNIMFFHDKPFFIDYQGGRQGALQYDVASLLYDGKANLPNEIREILLDEYLDELKKLIPVDEIQFRKYMDGYILIRIMQAMGCYGFRGFYEQKAHFLQSIPYALKNLSYLLANSKIPVKIPALTSALEKLLVSEKLKKINISTSPLKVTINSFSFKKTHPVDRTGNGGGFIFDCRALPNPGRYEALKNFTGMDKPIIEFLETKPEISLFLQNIYSIIDQSVTNYQERRFTNLMVNFGCTGGKHRSVYCAEQLANHLKKKFKVDIKLIHIEQDKEV